MSDNSLIINSPYDPPNRHHLYNRELRKFEINNGRRKSGYVIPSDNSNTFDDPGVFIEIPIVNKVRERVNIWRQNEYPGVTTITKKLLRHWRDQDQRNFPFFFCQLEAIETLIWFIETGDDEKIGIKIEQQNISFERLCCKMATGSGKTVVMSMLIAWQALNKIENPRDTRFSKVFLIVTPGHTVRRRLSVLNHSDKNNYYDTYNIIPFTYKDKFSSSQIFVRNWQSLSWDNEDKIKKRKSVDKRGPISDEAYIRNIFENNSISKNIVVINDEAHHAWIDENIDKVNKEEKEKATIWINALERIQRARGISKCYDFSATPFTPSSKKYEENLFKWIISDFNLNDAIECGLVKTPRVVVRDDALPDSKTYKSKLYHIYNDETVKDNLNKKADENEPLPDLIINAYLLLGFDWLETKKIWDKAKSPVPPVMITIANRIETSKRVYNSFLKNKIKVEELCQVEGLLRIDNKTISDIDNSFFSDNKNSTSRITELENLREKIDTVGIPNSKGQNLKNIISVNMLSEGWDAKTVTHIMGLRAFTSQLLCEQVVGRGLRRTSYELNEDGLFDAEYVNIFGVPFTFLPQEMKDGTNTPSPTKPKSRIEPDPTKINHEIKWPNVNRINTIISNKISIDLEKINEFKIDTKDLRLSAVLASTIEGKTDLSKFTSIDLDKINSKFRLQSLVFETTRDLIDLISDNYKGSKHMLLSQIIKITDKFINSNKLIFCPDNFEDSPMKRKIAIGMSLTKIIEYLFTHIKENSYESLIPIFDKNRPIRSTRDMFPWYTGKPCEYSIKSHINMCVYDSTWESSHSFLLDKKESVESWVKNEKLGFEIYYVHNGISRKYIPDFLIKLTNGDNIILETKGQLDEKAKAKKNAAIEWVDAINKQKKFGNWRYVISTNPKDLPF